MIKNLDMLSRKSDNTKENLSRLYDEAVEVNDTLSGISKILEQSGTANNRLINKAIAEAQENIKSALMPLIMEILTEEEDLRNQYLSNLKGYFNENTGTWYEKVCRNYFERTGFKANEWTALTYTIHLSLGQSTRDYLFHEGIITKNWKGEYVLPSHFNEDIRRECGNNVDLIKQHEANGFEDLT